MAYLVRLAFIIGAAALFAGCGGSQSPIGAPTVAQSRAAFSEKTFSYTGKRQTFTVPSGVTQIEVDARGAQGGGSSGGLGGRVVALIAVTPGEKLGVLVGGQPSTSGGFNGGGSGGTTSYCGDYCGYGGGGASDVRDGKKLVDRIVVAGGGGGQGGSGYPGYEGGTGGKGGAKKGGSGAAGVPYGGYGGSGGTQRQGGAGGAEGYGSTGNGAPGASGTLGDGGAGGQGCATASRCGEHGANGGGGGGGYYGGGGGGVGGGTISSVVGGGGAGGGSSYIKRGAKKLIDRRGWKNATGNGVVVISW